MAVDFDKVLRHIKCLFDVISIKQTGAKDGNVVPGAMKDYLDYLEKGRRKYHSKECQKFLKCYFIPRKEFFIVLSISLGLFNFACLINDLVQIEEFRKPWNSTQNFTTEIMLSNTSGFYFGILGFVYSVIKKSRLKYLAAFSIGWNFIMFLFRMALEIVFINYRPESFGND